MKRWFYLIVALQIAFLLAQAGRSELTLRRGRVVVLKTAPVDPRSLFMGNYMALGYDISQLDLKKIKHDAAVAKPDYRGEVYVLLQPGQPYARAIAVTTVPPKGGSLPYLRGTVEYHPDPGRLLVSYGLERYFIPEKRQEEVNRLANERWEKHPPQIAVEIVVTNHGHGLIKRVLVNGKALGY